MTRPAPARLIIAAGEHDADLFHATRLATPDPFIFLEYRGRRTIVLNDLEFDRGRRVAAVDEVLALGAIARELPGGQRAPLAAVAAALLKARRVRSALVPVSFPLGMARALARAGIRVRPGGPVFWPAREIKGAAELAAVGKALRITEIGMARAMEVLRAAAVRRGKLLWGGVPLTSGRLRAEIDCAVLRADGMPANTIVAGGDQACDPHERGTGPLAADTLIIIDIFPRDSRTGFFGDLTRTVVRGRATAAQRALWNTVLAGQKMALRAIKPGGEGRVIDRAVRAFFARQGFPTAVRGGRQSGFFHGLGHGLGLEIHEPPRFAAARFKPGHVLTVEPGLYFPGVGGVRIEDVIAVTDRGARVLSRFPRILEL